MHVMIMIKSTSLLAGLGTSCCSKLNMKVPTVLWDLLDANARFNELRDDEVGGKLTVMTSPTDIGCHQLLDNGSA